MYHITNRGVRKMVIFYDEDDYLNYLQLLKKTKQRYPFLLHAYCLMTNHVHLLLQTLDEPIYVIMKHLNANYAKYFNSKYNFTGHIFQSRYGAELVDTVEYELDCSKYIHLNPVEAHMVNKPEEYRWSSYRAYILQEKNPYVHTEKILSRFPMYSRSDYQKFVERNDKLRETPVIINEQKKSPSTKQQDPSN